MESDRVEAECNDCGWMFARPLDAGDGLEPEQNLDIAQRVIRNHGFRCGCDNDRDGWGDNLADVDRDLDLTEAADE